METLHCEAGHDWTRQSTRGRKPRLCPDHRPVIAVPARGEVTVDHPEPQEPRQTRKTEPQPIPVVEIPDSFNVNDEIKRQLDYIAGELQRKREQADVNLLVARRKDILRQIGLTNRA